jgi:hypothetical protein
MYLKFNLILGEINQSKCQTNVRSPLFMCRPLFNIHFDKLMTIFRYEIWLKCWTELHVLDYILES